MASETGIPIPYDPSALPVGSDRADGTDGRLGTPSGADQIVSQWPAGSGSSNQPIEELKDSPTIERAEQGTITHSFRMSWSEGLTRMATLGRGIIRTSSLSEQVKLLSSNIRREPGGTCVVTTVDEVYGGDTPPDMFEIIPIELGLHIMKHPRYWWAFVGANATEEGQNQMTIRLLQDYMENTSYAMRNAICDLLSASMGSDAGSGAQPPATPTFNTETNKYDWADGAKVAGTDVAKAAAREIIMKYWRGEENPSIVGWQMIWSEFSWRPLPLNPGGYIENPITEGGLPELFWSTKDPPQGSNADDSIFAWMKTINPQSYSRNGLRSGELLISWRREADQMMRQRTFWETQHKWVGSPVGHWDEDLYTYNEGPQVAGDFKTMT
jgi:hypothetical protein